MSGFSTSGGVHSADGAVDDSSLLSLVPPSAPSSAGGAGCTFVSRWSCCHLRQLVVEELRIDSCQDLVLQEGYILELELLMILHYCRWYLRLHLRQPVELLHLRQPVELLHLRQLVVEELRIDSCQDLGTSGGVHSGAGVLMILHYCRWYLRLHLRQPVDAAPSSAGGVAALSSAGGAAAPSSAGGAAALSSAGGAAALRQLVELLPPSSAGC